MVVELYAMQPSGPCRAVALVLEATETPYEFKKVDLQAGDQMKPDFLAMNPQHNVPTIKDGDFCMNESRAIAGYVANTYDKSGKLYPAEPKVRARVDQRLYFDQGVFYKGFGETVYPVMFGTGEVQDTAFDKLREILGWANDFVKPTGFVAGTEHLTIADLAFLATYSTIVAAKHVDLEPYADLNAWFEKVKGLVPNYEKADGEGAAEFGGCYQAKVGAGKKE